MAFMSRDVSVGCHWALGVSVTALVGAIVWSAFVPNNPSPLWYWIVGANLVAYCLVLAREFALGHAERHPDRQK